MVGGLLHSMPMAKLVKKGISTARPKRFRYQEENNEKGRLLHRADLPRSVSITTASTSVVSR
jgi:hypothetical protein